MLGLLLRLVLSMAVVMGVMWVAARLVRRRQGRVGTTRRAGNVRGPRKRLTEAPFDVVYRRPIGKGAAIALVQTQGRRLLVGVTEQSVNLLAEIPVEPLPEISVPDLSEHADQFTRDAGMAALDGASRPDTAWKLVLDSLRERTVRR